MIPNEKNRRMNRLLISTRFFIPTMLAIALGGCFGEYRDNMAPATLGSVSKAYDVYVAEIEKKWKHEEIIFNFSNFVDRRVPSSMSTYKTGAVIHTYDSDVLPGQAPGYIRSVMEQIIQPDRESINQIEELQLAFELRDMDMRILEGNFISGEFGRYYIRVEADVKVSDNYGNILVNKPYKVEYQTMRQAFSGHHPSIDEDWSNMMFSTRKAIKVLTYEIVEDTINGKTN